MLAGLRGEEGPRISVCKEGTSTQYVAVVAQHALEVTVYNSMRVQVCEAGRYLSQRMKARGPRQDLCR